MCSPPQPLTNVVNQALATATNPVLEAIKSCREATRQLPPLWSRVRVRILMARITVQQQLAMDNPSVCVQENRRSNGGKPNSNLIKVVGARKIWGTLKACSPATVSSTISKLLPSGSTLELRIRCKTKLLGSKSIWWFVIHGSEPNLTVLEEWEKVEIQTSWTLEPCLMAGPPPDTSLSQNSSFQTEEIASGSNSPTLSSASEKPAGMVSNYQPKTVNLWKLSQQLQTYRHPQMNLSLNLP